MKWDPRSSAAMVLVVGLLLMLAGIVIMDFVVALEMNRAPDQNVIELLEKAIVGVVGVIAGWFAAKQDQEE